METSVVVISIIVEDTDCVEKLNSLLHDCGPYIIGRMGIPYPKKGINIISVSLDAPSATIDALIDTLGRIPGVSAKAACFKK